MISNALVIKSTGKHYLVEAKNGKTFTCTVKGKFRQEGLKLTNPVAVGDKVEIDTKDQVITKILKRDNYIIRQSPKHRHAQQIIASNIDQAILLATISQPRTSTGFMDRFLITAEAYHIPTIIAFNKSDLLDEKENETFSLQREIYASIGYPCYLISSLNTEGIADIVDLLKEKITLLCGHSGVGKSTFINTLIPGVELDTKEISGYTYKGKHTTTFAEMFRLPAGGMIIDTPGIKEFGVLDFSPEEISHYYPEMAERIHDCKFHNCLHLSEPGCAVRKALEDGSISSERYKNYCRIVESVKNEVNPWE